ncbi:MAG: YHYH domain-containing protein [Nitrosopumilus sp.]|nr:YHYH domain-containing protein [Nitrosopumilus sp.]MBA3551207.1 YHYH domain-containing protein [Patescibacteria group bacterium]
MKKLSILIISFFIIPLSTFAHPGRTDSSGCHTCRTNCPNWGLDTGEYHCHNAKAAPQPEEPVRSIYNANGAGTTVPAPEYKAQPVTSKIEETKPVQITPQPTTSIVTTTSTSTTKKAEQPKSIQENIVPLTSDSQPVKSNWFRRFFSWLFSN